MLKCQFWFKERKQSYQGAQHSRSPLSLPWCGPAPDWSKCWPACCGSRWRRVAGCSWGPESPVSGICSWSTWGWAPGWGHTLSGAAEVDWLGGSDPSGWRRNTCWSRRPSSRAHWACLEGRGRGQNIEAPKAAILKKTLH